MKKILIFLILVGLISASCVPACPTGDLICPLTSIPMQFLCMMEQKSVQAVSGPFSVGVDQLFYFMISNPSIGNATVLYNKIIFAVESLFVVILLISSVKLIFSNILGPMDRAKAKEDLKKVFINMFLVWISFDIYAIAIQLSNAFAIFLSPSLQDWSNVLFPAFSNPFSFIVLIVALFALIITLVFAVIRWIMVYVGLFLFPLALAFESLPFTEVFGKFFMNIIIVNFIIQLVNALFMSIIVGLISIAPSEPSAILIAIGAFVLMTFIMVGLYFTAVLDAASRNNWMRLF